MSRKIDTFREALGNPLTIHNFVVRLAAVTNMHENVEVIVQSTQLPSDQLQTIMLHYLGENVRYPTMPNNGGEWSVAIPDNEQGIAFTNILKARNLWFQEITGVIVNQITTGLNIEVVMRTVNDSEVYKVILHNCYCIGRSTQNLDAGQPTASLIFNATFVYDWIEDNNMVDPSGNPDKG